MIPALAVAILQEAAEPVAAGGMTAFSWLFMIGSMGGVTLLTVWSFTRILRGRAHFDPDGTGPAHSPIEGSVDREGGV